MSTTRRKVGERKRKGFDQRKDEAKNALVRLYWELGLDLAEGPPTWEDDPEHWIEGIEWSLDDLDDMLNWCRKLVAEKRAELGFDSRLRALRNVTGRTPEEARAFLAKAAELEAGRGAR